MVRSPLTAPYTAVSVRTLHVYTLAQALRYDIPLESKVLIAVKRDTLIGTPTDRAVVHDDIVENSLFRRSRTRQGIILILVDVAHAETHIPDYNLARFDAHRMSAYTYTGSRSRLSGNRNTVFGNIEHSFQHDIAGYGKNDGTCAPFFYGTTKRTLYRRLAFIIVFECCHYIYFAATAAYGIFAISFGSGESGHLRRRCLLRPCAGKRKQGTKQNYKVPFHNDRIKHILLI